MNIYRVTYRLDTCNGARWGSMQVFAKSGPEARSIVKEAVEAPYRTLPVCKPLRAYKQAESVNIKIIER